jgi:hypothetical protein
MRGVRGLIAPILILGLSFAQLKSLLNDERLFRVPIVANHIDFWPFDFC